MKELVWLRFTIPLSIQLSSRAQLDLEKEEFENSLVFQKYHPTSQNKTPTLFPKLFSKKKNMSKWLKSN